MISVMTLSTAIFYYNTHVYAETIHEQELKIDGERSEGGKGPLFYSNDSDGVNPRKNWAPGETATRGFIIKNTGSLVGHLERIYCKPEYTGDKEDNEEFGEQAVVYVQLIQRKDGYKIDGNKFKELIEKMNRDHAAFDDPDFYNPPPDIERAISKAGEHIDKEVKTNRENEDNGLKITSLYSGLLKNLYNREVSVLGGSYELKSGEEMYITYTFHFLNLIPDSNNKLQGKKAQHSLQFIFSALPGGNPGGGGDGGGGGGEKNPPGGGGGTVKEPPATDDIVNPPNNPPPAEPETPPEEAGEPVQPGDNPPNEEPGQPADQPAPPKQSQQPQQPQQPQPQPQQPSGDKRHTGKKLPGTSTPWYNVLAISGTSVFALAAYLAYRRKSDKDMKM